MPGEKVFSVVVFANSRKGIFFFEFLTGIFLLSSSLTILWSGFSYILKNCNTALDLYTRVIIASELLESDKTSTFLKEEVRGCSVKKEPGKVYLESIELPFDIQIIKVSSLSSDSLKEVELWEYRGKN